MIQPALSPVRLCDSLSNITNKQRQFLIPTQRRIQIPIALHVNVVIRRFILISDQNFILDLEPVLQLIFQLLEADLARHSDRYQVILEVDFDLERARSVDVGGGIVGSGGAVGCLSDGGGLGFDSVLILVVGRIAVMLAWLGAVRRALASLVCNFVLRRAHGTVPVGAVYLSLG